MYSDLQHTLTFDDVLLVPQYSEILPKNTSLNTYLTSNIQLNLPIISAAMDTVTGHKMATAMALAGGIGIIHKNLTPQEQAEEVKIVKRFENGFIENPVTIRPKAIIKKVIEIQKRLGYKKIPVVDFYGRLVGIIRDIDFMHPMDTNKKVSDLMLPIKNMVVAKKGITLDQANSLIRKYKLKTLCIVDKDRRLTSIVSRRDIKKNDLYPNACKDSNKHLRVGAAISTGIDSFERANMLIKAKVDILVIDTAHGHSKGVIDMVRKIKNKYPHQQIIAGNIATAEAAKDLIEAGANAIKVGIGPGSICTTRVVSGIGVPQLSAIFEVASLTKKLKKQIPIIADGGIKHSGDIVKALAAGANTVMLGNMLAGADETPGETEYLNGSIYKTYRGMGSVEAMQKGSKDRYSQANINDKDKLVPEGVSGKVMYKGEVSRILYQLAGGIKSGLGYCGSKTISELQKKRKFVIISSSSLKENHPHDLKQIDSAPNYMN